LSVKTLEDGSYNWTSSNKLKVNINVHSCKHQHVEMYADSTHKYVISQGLYT